MVEIGAGLLVVALIGLFAWAWVRAPGEQALRQFQALWAIRPWGRQVIVDFYALEAVLAVWMLADAAARGGLAPAVILVAAMPVFGAIPAAVYLLVR